MGFFVVLSVMILLGGHGYSSAPVGHNVGQSSPVADHPAEMVFGDQNAPITVVEYSSLTCGHCAEFHRSVFPKIDEKYIKTGKVRFIIRPYPSDGVALQASAIVAARPPMARYKTYSKLMASQETWVTANDPIPAIADVCGLSTADCRQKADDEKVQTQLTQSRLEADQTYKIEGTPLFIINGRKFDYALTYAEFEKAVG